MSFCVSQPTGLSSETSEDKPDVSGLSSSVNVEVNRGHEGLKCAVCFHKFYFN